jgi:hypothetical protein
MFGGHGAHAVLLAAWVGVVVGVLVIDHVRGNRWRAIASDDIKSPSIDRDHETPVTPVRISMATWPPREISSAATVRPPSASRIAEHPWLAAAVFGSVIAAVIHVAVIPEHFEESFWYGAFFVVTAALQLGYATLLANRSNRTLLRAGIAGNGSVVLVWAYTRLIGVPLGPGRGEIESVGVLDILATSAELLIVLGCAQVLFSLRRSPPASGESRPRRAVVAAGR